MENLTIDEITLTKMKFIALYSILSLLSLSIQSQNRFFSGAVDAGVGLSMMIDNSRYNKGFTHGGMAGIASVRNLTNSSSLELGLNYSLYGHAFTIRSYAHKSRPFLRLHYIELPVLYVFTPKHYSRKNFGYILGYSNAILFDSTNDYDFYDVSNSTEVFKDYSPILYTGLQWDNLKYFRNRNIRIRALFSFSPLTILTKEARTGIQQNSANNLNGDNGRVSRLLISIGYVFN